MFINRGDTMKVSNSNEFGQKVRERRKKLNYTQSYISQVSGLSVSFLSDLENGKKTIELDKALLVVSLLGMDVNIVEREG